MDISQLILKKMISQLTCIYTHAHKASDYSIGSHIGDSTVVYSDLNMHDACASQDVALNIHIRTMETRILETIKQNIRTTTGATDPKIWFSAHSDAIRVSVDA